MGCCLNRLDEHGFIAVLKPVLFDFGIHYRFESCAFHAKSSILIVFAGFETGPGDSGGRWK